jgi:hypothetical protein
MDLPQPSVTNQTSQQDIHLIQVKPPKLVMHFFITTANYRQFGGSQHYIHTRKNPINPDKYGNNSNQ